MYAVLLTLALSPTTVDAAPKASAGCFGSVKSAGCYGQSYAVRNYRTPIRTAAHRLVSPKGKTTYYAATAVYVPVATVTQSAAPPVYRTPVRNAAAAVVTPRRCPAGVFCPQ